MRSTEAEARAMTDEQLALAETLLRREIPRKQALLGAIRRERKHRRRRQERAG